ncbi:MAG: hypothetical protein IPL36_10455 [Nigerium sp.]|nr:hypothetical protein [Nigerium sp.]
MHDWVDAAPFRAHLSHLCAATGLPWQVLALHADMPLRMAETLMAGRPGYRLPRPQAIRLLSLTAEDVRRLRSASVPAAPTASRLRLLLGHGVGPTRIAGVLGCASEHVLALADGVLTRTTKETALRVQVLEEGVWRGRLRRPSQARAPHAAVRAVADAPRAASAA